MNIDDENKEIDRDYLDYEEQEAEDKAAAERKRYEYMDYCDQMGWNHA